MSKRNVFASVKDANSDLPDYEEWDDEPIEPVVKKECINAAYPDEVSYNNYEPHDHLIYEQVGIPKDLPPKLEPAAEVKCEQPVPMMSNQIVDFHAMPVKPDVPANQNSKYISVVREYIEGFGTCYKISNTAIQPKDCLESHDIDQHGELLKLQNLKATIHRKMIEIANGYLTESNGNRGKRINGLPVHVKNAFNHVLNTIYYESLEAAKQKRMQGYSN